MRTLRQVGQELQAKQEELEDARFFGRASEELGGSPDSGDVVLDNVLLGAFSDRWFDPDSSERYDFWNRPANDLVRNGMDYTSLAYEVAEAELRDQREAELLEALDLHMRLGWPGY